MSREGREVALCTADHGRCEALKRRAEELQERVAWLESLLMETRALPVEWRLTPLEERIFGVLVSRDIATREAFMTIIYGDRADDAPDIKIVDAVVCRLRRKLKPFGIAIDTVWGRGYRLPPALRAALRQADQPASDGEG